MSDPDQPPRDQNQRASSTGAHQKAGEGGDELAMLRDDIAKLTESVSELLRGHTDVAGDRLRGAASDTCSTAQEAAGIFSRASSGLYADASGRLHVLSSELTDTVKRAPLISLGLAAVLGMIYGRLRG